MNPLLLSQLRKQWPLVAAVAVFLFFLLAHLLVFQPGMKRYRNALKQAGDLGIALDATSAPKIMPTRVFTLVSTNAMPEAIADAQGNSGELTASLLEEVTHLANQQGIDVQATEPGATSNLPHAIQVRAHVKARCSYPEFVAFLDQLDRKGRLISIDRFSLTNDSPGRQQLELWVTRYVLKQKAVGS
jgi:hypothetical protein